MINFVTVKIKLVSIWDGHTERLSRSWNDTWYVSYNRYVILRNVHKGWRKRKRIIITKRHLFKEQMRRSFLEYPLRWTTILLEPIELISCRATRDESCHMPMLCGNNEVMKIRFRNKSRRVRKYMVAKDFWSVAKVKCNFRFELLSSDTVYHTDYKYIWLLGTKNYYFLVAREWPWPMTFDLDLKMKLSSHWSRRVPTCLC